MAQITKDRAIAILTPLIANSDQITREFRPLLGPDDAIPAQSYDLITETRANAMTATAHLFGENSRQMKTIYSIKLPPFQSRVSYHYEYISQIKAALISMANEICEYWDDQTPAQLIRTVQEAASSDRTSNPPARYNRSDLLWNMTTCFDMSEIETICFTMGIDFEAIRGEEKTSKARELIMYCERNGRTGELIAVCQKLRPNVVWVSDAAL